MRAILADLTIDGRMRKIIIQPSKEGWLYVFDRQTGQPIWPIEERPVEKGTVPGEWYSPTQPHVTKHTSCRDYRKGPDRFHPGDQSRRGESLVAVQNRPDFHAADCRW